jgi:hypothetical protein
LDGEPKLPADTVAEACSKLTAPFLLVWLTGICFSATSFPLREADLSAPTGVFVVTLWLSVRAPFVALGSWVVAVPVSESTGSLRRTSFAFDSASALLSVPTPNSTSASLQWMVVVPC